MTMWCSRFCNSLSRLLFAVVLGVLSGLPEQAPAQYNPTFPMPDVIGLTVSEAQDRVLNAGRNSRVISARAVIAGRRTDRRPAGQIIRQLDAAGRQMRPYLDDVGGNYGEVTFSVVVSLGPPAPTTFSMPDVVGLEIPDAERRVLLAGRQVRVSRARADIVERRADQRPAGQIIRQLDAAGKQMRPYLDDVGGNYGEVTFRVVVSTGPERAPGFVGKHLDEVRWQAEQEKIDLNVAGATRNSTIAEGIVVRQNPDAGEAMLRRSVTVYPSAGYPLPNYVNRPIDDARLESQRLGFRLEEHREEHPDVPRDIIFEQDPPAGVLLPFEEPVHVVVSAGRSKPDIVDRSRDGSNKKGRKGSAGHQSPWLWPVIGLLAFVAAIGVFKLIKTRIKPSTRKDSLRTDDPGGIRLRVTRDHGFQSTDKAGADETDQTGSGEIVKIRVQVDLGQQSAGPVDDKERQR